MTICHNQEKELNCGENKKIQILDGTNFGSLDADTCNDNNASTGTSESVGGTTSTTNSITTNVAGNSGTSNTAENSGTNVAAGRKKRNNAGTNNSAGTLGTNNAAGTSNTNNAAVNSVANNAADTTPITTTNAPGSSSNYTQCKVENSTEKVKEL